LVSLILACAAESKSTPIVVSSLGSTGTNSKRNFHRPQSNCGVAINSASKAFMVLISRRPNACASSVAGISPGLAHRGRGREGDYRANEGAEHGKPETCLHANYLKHSEIEISEIFEMT
jgi:hypothetical protein